MDSVSIYVHIPFCNHRCSYCDFNTYSGLEWLIPRYIEAICTEAVIISRTLPDFNRIGTIYLGGGTPSLLDIKQVEQIIVTIMDNFTVEKNAEISLEMNPGTVSLDFVKDVHGIGVTRLSIGMQSSNPHDLRVLDRVSDHRQVIRAMEWSRKAGFDNVSLDLIYGIPGQYIQRWKNSLELAIGLGPDHISIYALTIEERTPMGRWIRKGLIEPPDQDTSAEMYEWASESLANNHYHQYEISNWAKFDVHGKLLASRHNMQYWLNLPYLGLGAGAHSYIDNHRIVNLTSPVEYIQRIEDRRRANLVEDIQVNGPQILNLPAYDEYVSIDKETEMSETMIMGLRLIDQGIEKSRFFSRFGIALEDVYNDEIDYLVRLGLLEWTEDGERVRLSVKGRLLGNLVFLEFI